MTFLGLVAMIDPPRSEVEDAIRKCKNAGIRIIMITGDQMNTALAIAQSLDLKPYEDTFYLAHTSSELEAMNDEEFKETLKDLDVCARASPSIKKRIVETLQDEFGLVWELQELTLLGKPVIWC
jgi:Ca2+-transporting ATPase